MLDKANEPEQIELDIRKRAAMLAAGNGVDSLTTSENGGVLDLTLSEALLVVLSQNSLTIE